MSSRTSSEVRSVVDRLRRIDPAKPVLDRTAVEQAMRAHLEALGLPERPIVWVPSAAAGYARVMDAATAPAKAAAGPAACSAAAMIAAKTAAGDPAWSGAREAASPAADAATAVWNTAWTAAGAVVRNTARAAAWATAWAALWDAAKPAAWDVARTAAWSPAECVAREAARAAARIAAADAALDAAKAAAWEIAGASHEFDRLVALNPLRRRRQAARWLPMVEAFEAGLSLYWVMQAETVCVPAPAFSIRDNRLHNDSGPAVAWPSPDCSPGQAGERYWFWKGIKVPQWLIEQPQSVSFERIKRQPNAELRRCMIERFGYERYLEAARAKKVDEDETGVLWRCRARRTLNKAQNAYEWIDAFCVVEVLNGSLEPDGTRRHYFLIVPPACRTAKEAVAWTYGLTANQYADLVLRT